MSANGDGWKGNEGKILRTILLIAAIVAIFVIISMLFGEGPILVLRLVLKLLGAFL